MEMHIVISDTETGATISLLSGSLEWSNAYSSWEQALDEALRLGLMSKEMHDKAQSLPPAFPYCGDAQVTSQQITVGGFIYQQHLAA